MTPRLETEFRLRALRPLETAAFDAALRESAFACRTAGTRRHVDTYFDDEFGSLAAGGLGLRLRDDGTRPRITCKARGEPDDGLFVRPEVEQPWPTTTPPSRASDLPDEVRDLVEPFVFDRALHGELRLEVERDHRTLQQDGRDACEVVLDRVTARHGDRTVAFIEVEIDVLDDLPSCERLVQTLADRLPLRAADDDKPGHAARLLGVPFVPPPATWHGADPARDAIAALAVRHVLAIKHAEAALRIDDGPDPLHALRVAVRRLRGFVRSFRSAWSPAAGEFVLTHLADTSRHLGAPRDLDVMLTHLAADAERLPSGLRAAAEAVLGQLRASRDASRTELGVWLRSAARTGAARAAEDRLRTLDGDGSLADVPVTTAAAAVLDKAVRKARSATQQLADDLPLSTTHACRVRIKRVRYLAEEFEVLLPAGAAKSIAALARLQAVLGDVCDRERAATRCIEWVGTVADPMASAALGGLATQETRAARSARRRARQALAEDSRGKVWRRLRP